MGHSIEHIELIEAYINKSLTEKEIKEFENRIETDLNFRQAFETQLVLMKGIERQALKSEIIKAKQLYVRNKWAKIIGFSIFVAAVSVLTYFLLFNHEKSETYEIKKSKGIEVIIDTVPSPENIEILPIVKDSVKAIIQEKEIQKFKEEVNLEHKSEAKKAIQETYKKAPEIFKINTTKDTIITCAEGTQLNIKANTFIDANNNLVNGFVDFKVAEFNELSDMLLANLSTTSHDELLETGGMLYVEVKKDNEQLKLKKEASIEISFPMKSKKEGMKIFLGNWNNDIIDWQLQHDSALEQNIASAEIILNNQEENVRVPFSVVEQPPIFPGCEQGDKIQQKKCMSEAISGFVRENFNTDLASQIGLRGRQRINVIFSIGTKGKIFDIQVRAPHPILILETERVLSLLPEMTPGRQRGKTVVVSYSMPIVFNADTASTSVSRNSSPIDSSIVKNLEDKIINSESNRISKGVVDSYVLMTSNLGWINCDRFVRKGRLIKYKVNVNDRGVARVNMVFKSLNSILPSRFINGGYDFGSVTKGEEVVIVAIKKYGGKLYLHVGETIIEETPKIEFNYKEVTISELKSELEKLNKLFN